MKNIKNSLKQTLAALLAIIMVMTSFPLASLATDEGDRPADGKTEGQPFIVNQPSETYRIPSMVSLDDGTIVAAADARWDSAMDGGGNDTILARSTDGGNTWDNQFVTYYPDNGNSFNKASTSVCDTELVTDGKNIWMLTVFFPAGWALTGSSADNQLTSNNGTAFIDVNGTSRVKLTNNGGASYDYYIGDFDKEGADGRANICNLSDGSSTGYTVDHDYYIYENGVKLNANNLFYSDGTFQTAKVNFLLFRKSTDGGKSWSSFTPINVKNPEEAFFGVGPGRGIYDKAHNRIIFSTYTWSGSNNSQRSSFVYSDDDGKTWKRSPNFPDLDGFASGNWSSESTLVQLDDKTLRCFVRNGWQHLIYADAVYQPDGSYQWTGFNDINYQINGEKPWWSVGENSGCQLSAIKYSKKLQYNGEYCSVILLSTPYDTRANGVIYTIVLDENNNIINTNEGTNKAISYSVSSGYFGYSCLTELPDGSVVDLFEVNEARNITFSRLPSIEKITGLRVPNEPHTYNYTLPTGSTEVFLVDGKDETANGLADIKYDDRTSVYGNLGNSTAFDGVSIPLSDALFDFKRNTDGTWLISAMGVYLSIVEPQLPSSIARTNIRIQQDGDRFRFLRDKEAMAFWRSGDKIYQYDQSTAHGGPDASPGGGVAPDRDKEMCLFEVYRLATASENKGAGPVPGFIRVTDINEIKDGGQYIIGCQVEGSYYFLYPSTSKNNTYSHSVKMNPTPVSAGYYMTVKPYKAGTLTLKPGSDTYNFEFVDYSNEILGVVNYDPVIYTHGGDTYPDMSFTHLGSQIADGTYQGERETCFRFNTTDAYGDLSNEFRIVSVTAIPEGSSTPVPLEYTYDDTTKEYKLKGTLNLANTDEYKDFTKGKYVTLKTTLEEIDSNEIYTQTDRLYVTSNPVPAHIASGMNHEWKSGSTYKWQPMCTYILAPGSIGNTNAADRQKILNELPNSNSNAKRIFEKFTYNSNLDSLKQPLSADVKSVGITDSYRTYGYTDIFNNHYKGSHENKFPSDDLIFNQQVVLGYYYYDKSSPKNEGVTNISNNGNSFSIELQRKTADLDFSSETTNPVPIKIGTQNTTNRSTFNTYLGADRSIIGKIRGDASADITKKTYDQVFGSGTYYTGQDGQTLNIDRTATADCTINAQPNQKGSLTGVVRYQEGREDFGSGSSTWNDLVLPFEIKYCDKSVERNAYNNSIKDVLKSTDFTAATWEAYMNKALVYQEYLNNYIIQTKEDYKNATGKDIDQIAEGKDIPDSYDKIQKRAQWDDLLNQLTEKREIIDNGIEISNDQHYTPDSFEYLDMVLDRNQKMYDDAGINDGKWMTDGKPLPGNPSADEVRSETPGWDIGPYSETKLQIQKEIDNAANQLKNGTLKIAADDDVYVAVKNEFNLIDKTAYEDNGDQINEVFVDGDSKFYKPYNGKTYVNIPEENQEEIDNAIRDALNKMNVGLDTDTENPDQVKTYNIKVYVNGGDTPVFDNNYRYGYVLDYNFAQHFTSLDTQVVKCISTSDRNGNITETTLKLEDYAGTNYVVPILIQNDMVINITVTDKAAPNQLIVKDYYGTVIGILTGTEVTIAGDTVTVGDQEVKAKLSPRYVFGGWNLKDGTYPITEGMSIYQWGTKTTFMGSLFTVEGGTVNGESSFNANYLNAQLDLASDNAKYWTRTVLNDAGEVMIPESLASYEKDFVNFSSGQDVHYKAYNDIASLPDEVRYKVQSDVPAINGVGYYANGKFTLSVDYSASENVNVLDSGIIYSTVSGDDLVKDGKDAKTFAAARIAHWTNNPNSGTFTMSTTANFDVAYLRAYVSYTKTYSDSSLPYVAYSDVVYKCEKQEDGSYVVVPMI